MEDLRSDMRETQVIDIYTSWLNNNYGITGTGAEPASLFDICYQYTVPDPGSPPEETAYQEQQRRQYEHDCRYWLLPEYDSCRGGYWGNDLFSGGGRRSLDDDGYNDWMVKTEDTDQSEDQNRGYSSYWKGEFSQPDYDYNPWSLYHCGDSGEDEDSYGFDGQEPITTYGYRIRMDQIELCEGIFGYFPCWLREQNEYINML